MTATTAEALVDSLVSAVYHAVGTHHGARAELELRTRFHEVLKTADLDTTGSVICEHEPVCRRRSDGWPECAPLRLTDAEREALLTRPREFSVSRDAAVLEGIVERILSDRVRAALASR